MTVVCDSCGATFANEIERADHINAESGIVQPKRRLSWTVFADCYADDEAALREDAMAMFYDGLLGGYALDVRVSFNFAVDLREEDLR